MNLIERAGQLADGVKTLTAWLGAGGETVDRHLAQVRANTCLRCPLHLRQSAMTEAVASAIKRQLELKSHFEMRVAGEKSLHTCSVCGCAMRLKIWLPLRNVLPTPDEAPKFDANCWLITEQKT